MKKFLSLVVTFMAIVCTAMADPILPGTTCASATAITAASSNTTYTTFGATGSGKPAYFPGMADDDVWFKFTATSPTATTYKVVLDSFLDHDGGGFPPSPIMELWLSCDSAVHDTATQGGYLSVPHIIPGHTYFVRVYTNGTALHANFKISVSPIDVAANDDPATATVLTPVSACTTGQGPFSTEGATKTGKASGDFSGSDDDVWFKFTTGTTDLAGHVVIMNDTLTSSGGVVIELWPDTAAASNDGFFPFSHNASLGTLLPNTTYYVRVYSYGSSARISTFRICVSLTPAPPPPPANDAFLNATAVTINQAATCVTEVTGATTKGATTDGGPGCSGGPANIKDVWFKFTAVTATATINITGKTLLPGSINTNAKLWMQVYDGSNTAPTLLCSDNGQLDFNGNDDSHKLHPGHTYYIRIYNDEPGNASSFNICTQAPVSPAYDECFGAINIQPSPTETCTNGIEVSNVNATALTSLASCMGNVGSDIWLKFTAPAYDNLEVDLSNYISLTGNLNPLIGIAVYSGNCNVLTQVSCTSGKVLKLPALTHGQPYFIRIMAFDGADAGTFTICVHGAAPLPADTICTGAITLVPGRESTAAFTHASFTGVHTNTSLTDCGNHTFVFSKALWYKFVADTTALLIDVQNIKSVGNNITGTIGYKFYPAAPGPSCTGITSSVCQGDITHQNNVLTSLVPGNTYFVQVLINTYNGDDASFDIRMIHTTYVHNNEPVGADLIIENPVYNPSLATAGSFKFSTVTTSPAPAAGTYAGDVWYMFKAATTAATIKVNYGGSPVKIQVYNHTHTGTPVYDGAAGGTFSVTGLTIDETYYIRVYNPQPANGTTANSAFYISAYGTPSADAASVAPVGTNCVTADGPITSTNSQKWLHIIRGGKMVASIFDDAAMGVITTGYYTNSGALRETPAHVSYLDRNFSITPAVHPATPVKVLFYFTKAEFDRLTSSNHSHVNYLNDLTIAAFNGEACSSTLGATGETNYGITGYGSLSAGVYYIEVSIPHFSGYFIKSGFGVTLPVSCYNFNGTVNNAQVQLSWQTASEQNSSYFDVQRSSDGVGFNSIGTVSAAGNSNTARYYRYTDAAAKQGDVYYYRLKAIDKDGTNRFACSMVKVATGSAGNELFGKAYPNPAVNSVNINIQKAYTGKVTIQVVNMMGQVLSQKVMDITNNTGQVTIPTYQLPAGAYTIRLATKDGVYTKAFTKLK